MRVWLFEERKRRGMSQKQIATICGISRQYYSFIENGTRNASVIVAKRIGYVLNIPWQKFFE